MVDRVIRFAERNWRPDSRTLVNTGDYRIPEDMTAELAQRAVDEGAAVHIWPPSEPPAATRAPARRKTA